MLPAYALSVTRVSVSSMSFFFTCDGAHRDLHSFPTRRSSDLVVEGHGQGHRHRPGHRLVGGAGVGVPRRRVEVQRGQDRKSTRLNSSHLGISYAVFCLKKKRRGRSLLSHLRRGGTQGEVGGAL